MTTQLLKRRADLFQTQWLFFWFGCVLVWGSFLFHAHSDWRETERNERRRLQAQVRVIEKNLIWQIEETDRMLSALRRELPRWRAKNGYAPEAFSQIRTFADIRTRVRTLLVLNAAGVIELSNRPEILHESVSHRDYFQTAMHAPDPDVLYLSRPFRTNLGAWGMILSRVIEETDGDEESAGVVSAALDPQYLAVLLDSVRYAPDMWVSIFHGDGVEYLRVSNLVEETGLDVSGQSTPFARHKAGGAMESVLTGADSSNGPEMFVALRTVSPSDGSFWDKSLIVAAGRDRDAVFMQWRQQTFWEGAFVVLISGTFFLMLRRYHGRLRESFALQDEADRVLQKSEARFRELAFASADWIWEVDERGRYTYVAGGVDRLGYKPEDMIGRYFADFMLPEDARRTRAQRKRFAAAKESFSDIRISSIAKNGAIHHISSSGRPILDAKGEAIGFRGVDRDVTELQKAEDQLRMLSSAVEQSPLLVSITDTEGVIVYVNQGFVRISGYAAAEVLGKTARLLRDGALPCEEAKHLRETVLAGGTWYGEFVNHKKSGEPFWESVSVSPIRDSDGEITRLLLIKKDVTENKKAARALVDAKREAEKASRAKSYFLAQMSHELRTPINAVIGFADMLLGAYFGPLGEKQAEYVEDIRKAGKHLLSLIAPILDLSRIEAGRLELLESDISVRLLVDECLAIMRGQVGKKNLEIRAELASALPDLRADEQAVRQILLNILGNAAKFTPDGGTITVSAELSTAGGLDIVVTDTGTGIASDDIENLFQPFKQGDPYVAQETEGVGLGLVIAKALVEAHQGKIHVESAPGAGTSVHVAFPPERLRSCASVNALLI